MADPPKKESGKVLRPELRKRLHAWWEGYEYDKPPAAAPQSAAAPAAAPEPMAASSSDVAHPDPIKPPMTGKVVVKDQWPRERIKVAQLVWGDGFTFPGAVDFVLKLAGPLALQRESIGLDLGCGLGAGTRALAQTTGAWMEGYDLSLELAQTGAGLSRAAGLESKAPIGFLDAAEGSFKPKRYDGVLVRNVFSLISDKPKLLTRLAHGMKPGAKLVVFDWAISREDAHGPALDAYRLGEATAPRLSTQAQFAAQIETAGLGIADNEDFTAAFRAEILVGWAQIDRLVARGQLDPREGEALMGEAKLWARRLAAMDSGDLRVVRIVAAKKA
ncbi:MAG: methyltransferase domain-containing protein [Telmatospirillum sp.]|nr:methyltransferase domain-containing protein [Telmatospirillum sp.]